MENDKIIMAILFAVVFIIVSFCGLGNIVINHIDKAKQEIIASLEE